MTPRTKAIIEEVAAWVLATALFAGIVWCVMERERLLPGLYATKEAK